MYVGRLIFGNKQYDKIKIRLTLDKLKNMCYAFPKGANMKSKIERLCEKITNEGQELLKKRELACQCNLDSAVAHYHIGKKYIRVDVGGSGKYMVDLEGNIYGIKAYGVIHKGHCYGTLDTIDDWFWGDFRAEKKTCATI